MKVFEVLDLSVEIVLLIVAGILFYSANKTSEFFTKESFYIRITILFFAVVFATFSYVIGSQRKQRALLEGLLEQKGE